MSYVKIWLHCVWSTKDRECIIPMSFRPVLLKHFREYAPDKGISLDYINAHLDHVHALVNMGKQQSISEIMKLLKGESSFWMNAQNALPYPFAWQDDYFAASVSHSHVEKVRNYIKNQDDHHKHMSREEELDMFIYRYGFEKISDL